MTDREIGLFQAGRQDNILRLRTVIAVRWVAITGQVSAIIVAQWLYRLQLEVGLCFLAVGIAMIGNLVAMFVFPENKRLTESQNFFIFLFDLVQLSFLLFLTGGLHNPFSILVVGPVTLSATLLTPRSTLTLGAVAIALATVLVEYHLPLRTEQGFVLRIPDVFVYGNWVAIVIAILFLGAFSQRAMAEMKSMTEALAATQMALAREQRLTDLGGVVAAAAHELGTPLATIKLASSELIDELDERDDLREDARLIREQADRCRDILRSMGRAGKDDLQLRRAPLRTLLEEAAEPHMDRSKEIEITERPDPESAQDMPFVNRRPEMIHGLRNLIQNAVDFADTRVWIELGWDDRQILVRILDDGPGYPAHMIGRIGDPFMRRRRTEGDRTQRPEYEGMGLGLFIAKTLLERSGAELSFDNGTAHDATAIRSRRVGAIVEVIWPRDTIEAPVSEAMGALGENPVIDR